MAWQGRERTGTGVGRGQEMAADQVVSDHLPSICVRRPLVSLVPALPFGQSVSLSSLCMALGNYHPSQHQMLDRAAACHSTREFFLGP